ncbi:hypothetical protein AWH61_14310 [Alteromonas sp. W12]|uniref:PEP-CTERM sorting domain-containing protein n=1 Tax=Alteromonas sp. W12 TaxID=1772289 RepID=UPI0009490D9A|nr:PEP-CTERM sorting domain-containing protein [Alteromonas sp. W12]OLF74380.1 hypothetical protein AWH61_14310 [Alteromonas sp. W12]
MKKFFLLLMAAATFNANAAYISITTDKDIYNVGETITATVRASELSLNGVQTYFFGYDIAVLFDSLFVSFDPTTVTDLGAIGIPPFEPLNDSSANSASLSSATIAPVKFFQEGKTEVDIFSFVLVALESGMVDLSFSEAELSNNIGSNLFIDTPQGTSFEIAQVPAPGTFALSLLALGGMFFARKRVKS